MRKQTAKDMHRCVGHGITNACALRRQYRIAHFECRVRHGHLVRSRRVALVSTDEP